MSENAGGHPFLHITSVGDSATKGVDTVLKFVNINTMSSSSILKIYGGPFGAGASGTTPSTTGSLIAVIDGSSNSSGRFMEYQIRCVGGLYAVLTGGNSDVTITYA